MKRRRVAYVVKVTVQHEGQPIDLYLAKRAAKKTGRPWTLKQGKALRFASRNELAYAILMEERARLGLPQDMRLRIVALVRSRRPTSDADGSDLARIHWAA